MRTGADARWDATAWLFALAIVLGVAMERIDGQERAAAISGRWQTIDSVAEGPYSLELKQDGPRLTGTIRQHRGPLTSAVRIVEGRSDGAVVEFKATSPDSERTVSFKGRLQGTMLVMQRDVKVHWLGSPGGKGLFGKAGLPVVAFRRMPEK